MTPESILSISSVRTVLAGLPSLDSISAGYKAFDNKSSFYSHGEKIDLYENGFAPGLALITRLIRHLGNDQKSVGN